MPSQTATQENQAAGVIPAAPWRIKAVSVLPEFKLAVSFGDGSSGVVDCSSIQNSANPGIYSPLATPEYFANVKLELGVLTWPNGADLDPSWLHAELAEHKTWSVPFQLHADGILEVVCRPHDDWPGHRAGQFLLADFGAKAEGAHPFTIAWQRQTGTLTLAIKALGDFTGTLAQTLHVGQRIKIEGPYGTFDFCPSGAVDRNRGPAPQIWVAGGIGVTPFLARLNDRIAGPSATSETDFFYCTPQAPAYPESLESLCQQAGVRLHRRLTDQQGPLNPADIEARLKPGTSVWFCGPAGWGEALGKTLTGNDLPREAFHREAFEFR